VSAETDLQSLAGLAGLIDVAQVDGVPTLLARREGPLTGGLVFRVGRADETLATAGITHLVEHLALHRQTLAELHHNGETANTYTSFYATGTPAEVVRFLNDVCASLRDLPLERLETEKEILRTEAARRESGRAFDAMALWRYGAQGPGLAAYDEEGLSRLTASDVTAWERSHFTRDNAVLFLTSGTVPEGLDLRLPAGRRMPVVLPPEALPSKPAWFRGAGGGILVDALVPRSTPALLFARVATRMLIRALRQEGGLSYTAACEYEPVSAGTARVAAYADALPGREDGVVQAVVETLAALREGLVDEDDLVVARKLLRQEAAIADIGASMLPTAALNLLTGHPAQHPDELRAEQDAVTVDDIAAVARQFWDDALAQVPDEGLDWAGFVPAPEVSESEVTGDDYHHVDEPGVALVIAEDGVSLRTPYGPVTVRYEDCVLMSAYPDGGRRLVGRDGFRVVVEPTLYRQLTPEIVAATIDAHVPARVTQWLPVRSADAIP
jgi:predicted Zn-dependent peptidase